MRKVFIGICVGILALAGSVAFAGPAMATEAPAVTYPIEVHADWYAPTPATVANAFAVPQHLTPVLTCGGVHQSDYYTIDSAEAMVAYNALLATNTLNSAAEDAPFHPHNYTVTALPDCPPPTVAILPVTSTPATCDTAATYTVPVQPTGVKYALVNINDESTRPVPGTFTLADGVSLTINAHSIAGYAPVSKDWTVVGAKATGVTQSTDVNAPCYAAPPVTDKPTAHIDAKTPLPSATLAYTGGSDVTTGLIPWGVAFLFAGVGFAILKRRFNKARA